MTVSGIERFRSIGVIECRGPVYLPLYVRKVQTIFGSMDTPSRYQNLCSIVLQVEDFSQF